MRVYAQLPLIQKYRGIARWHGLTITPAGPHLLDDATIQRMGVCQPRVLAGTASYEPEELFGMKLRALLQRRKNRDLFDLNEGLVQLSMNAEKVVATFGHYLRHEGHQITRANADERMLAKLTRSLSDDIAPLLAAFVVYGASGCDLQHPCQAMGVAQRP